MDLTYLQVTALTPPRQEKAEGPLGSLCPATSAGQGARGREGPFPEPELLKPVCPVVTGCKMP